MNPKTEKIPGLRKPTSQEQQWIRESWAPELRRRLNPNAGKLVRYVGYFLICTGVVNSLRNSGSLADILLVLPIAAILLALAGVGRNSARRHEARLRAIEGGDYLVAETVTRSVKSTYHGNTATAAVTLSLPGGEPVQGMYEAPDVFSAQLLRNGQEPQKMLLIHMPATGHCLAIPAPK